MYSFTTTVGEVLPSQKLIIFSASHSLCKTPPVSLSKGDGWAHYSDSDGWGEELSLQPGPAMCSKCSQICHTFILLCLFHVSFELLSESFLADCRTWLSRPVNICAPQVLGWDFLKECGLLCHLPWPCVANPLDDIWWYHRLKLPPKSLVFHCSQTWYSSSPQRLRRSPNVVSVSTLPPLQSGCFEWD